MISTVRGPYFGSWGDQNLPIIAPYISFYDAVTITITLDNQSPCYQELPRDLPPTFALEALVGCTICVTATWSYVSPKPQKEGCQDYDAILGSQ